MRTTLDIDQDVLLAAREIAEQRGISVGKALSELARRALTPQITWSTRNGGPLFPRQGNAGLVTLELVNSLREGAP